MKKKITFKGNEITLVGRGLKKGKPAPGFRAVNQQMQPVELADYKEKIKVITSFLSLDTPVCDNQVKEFNQRAVDMSEDVVVIGISNDLPFAQKRFCEMNDIDNVDVLSDYKYSSFALNYGLMIKELNLVGRSVIILDKNGVIRYIEVVQEATDTPDYDAAVEALDNVLKNPEKPIETTVAQRCKPCEGEVPSLKEDEISEQMKNISGWELVDSRKIKKTLSFDDFKEAKFFLDLVAIVAEDQGHHPDLKLRYNKLDIELTTHAADGLTENDFIMAGVIDDISSC